MRNIKMSTKGAQFLHLACQGGASPLSPISYATGVLWGASAIYE